MMPLFLTVNIIKIGPNGKSVFIIRDIFRFRPVGSGKRFDTNRFFCEGKATGRHGPSIPFKRIVPDRNYLITQEPP